MEYQEISFSKTRFIGSAAQANATILEALHPQPFYGIAERNPLAQCQFPLALKIGEPRSLFAIDEVAQPLEQS